MTRAHLSLLKGSWLGLCMPLVFIPLDRIRTNGNPESNVIFVFGMRLLTFPSGLLVGLAVALIGRTTGWSLPWDGARRVLVVSITWMAYLALGYPQWFVVCPRLIQWLRRRMSVHIDESPGNRH